MAETTSTPARKQLAFTLVAIALTWLLLEAGALVYMWLRPQWGIDMQFLYGPHPYRAFAPVPNTIDRNRMRTFNSLGLRGPEISVRKPPATIRIVCLGASTTYSDGASTDSHTYPARMERLLRRHYRDAPFRIEVINAGVQACVSIETLIYFETRLLDLSPDIAIIHHGINDSWFMIAVPGFQSDYSHARHTFTAPRPKWWEYSPFLSWLVARNSINNPYFPAPSVNLNVLILNRPDLVWFPYLIRVQPLTPRMLKTFERNLRSFVYVARGNGVIPVLSTQVFHVEAREGRAYNQAVAVMNNITRSIAKSESVALIDFAKAMPWSEENFYDGCHLRDKPTALGRKAEIFANALVGMGLIERAYERLRKSARTGAGR